MNAVGVVVGVVVVVVVVWKHNFVLDRVGQWNSCDISIKRFVIIIHNKIINCSIKLFQLI